MSLATTSLLPPGALGKINRMGLVGNLCCAALFEANPMDMHKAMNT